MQDLTGTWSCQDGLTYYFTQVGNTLFIAGNNNSVGGFKNVGFGIINSNTQSVILQWADTPNSNGFGNNGILYMDASVNNQLTKKAGDARYGIGDFTRI